MAVQTIMLVLTIIMPASVPDKVYSLKVPSIEECWDQARDYVKNKDAVLRGAPLYAVGVAAACGVIEQGDKT